MDFSMSARARKLLSAVTEFMDYEVIPVEDRYRQEITASGNPYSKPPIMHELQAKAKTAGLWNLFLPECEWTDIGLTNVEYAPLCEQMGRSLIGPEAFNCDPPDTGNIGLLIDFGTPQQQEQWLPPLLDGTISSCFSMTEPDVASSDANNIRARIDRDGDSYIINGRKAPSTGGAREVCKLSIFVGVTDPDAESFRRQSLILVPLDTPGVEVVRTLDLYGYQQPISQAEIHFTNVRVPGENLLRGEGDGFMMSQARLGPGRIHHCMRALGMAERALELLCQWVATRETFGVRVADQGVVREWIALSRLELEQARLLTLKTAWMIDELSSREARKEIAEIKIAVPAAALNVIDRAVQAHGAAGLSQKTPLAEFWAQARTLRIVDGPDEVHVRSLGRWELNEQLAAAGHAQPARA